MTRRDELRGIVDAIKSKLPFPKLVGEHLELKRCGSRFVTRCPFHDEATPSFTAYEDHGHCFGCGWHGDVIAFVRALHGLGFQEAVESVAEAAGLRLDRDRSGSVRRHSCRSRTITVPTTRNLDRFWRSLRGRTSQAWLEDQASLLGVQLPALDFLGAVRHPEDSRCIGFPMCWTQGGSVVGIRWRWAGGKKRTHPGSRNGLFVPSTLRGHGPLFICEGPTDTAAVCGLELDVVGRPDAASCMERLVGAAQGRDIVICADRDQAGMRGAHKAMETCKGLARFVRVIWPPAPHKDMRAWLTEGGATLVDVLRLAGRAPDFSDRQGAPLRFDG